MSFAHRILLISFISVLITSLGNNIYFLFVFSLLCCIILPHNKYWDKTAVALTFFSILYLVIQLANGNAVDSRFVQISYLLAPVSFYRFGRFLFAHSTTDESKQRKILFICILYLMPLFIYTAKDIALVGFVNQSRQLLGDTFGQYRALSATLYGLMASVGIGCVASLVLTKQQKLYRLLFLVIAVLSLVSVVHLVNRTGLVICAGSILISFVAVTKMRISKILPLIIMLVVVFYLLTEAGILNQDIVDAYTSREKDSSYDASSAGGRTDLWLDAFQNLFIYPFGWKLVRYAHNLWLDIARVSGIFALIPFLYVTYRMVVDFLKVLKWNKTNSGILLLTIVLATLLNAAVEPVIYGSLLFFSLMIMFWGMLRQVALETQK